MMSDLDANLGKRVSALSVRRTCIPHVSHHHDVPLAVLLSTLITVHVC
jgi:hypothetical protein